MTFDDLSTNSQDYLKMIWGLQEWDSRPIQPSVLAAKAGVKLSTVSGAVTRLSASGLVEHQPYGGVTLTEKGRQYAIKMVRRHRLIETFLVRMLGYKWDEVHDEAEELEHAVSDMLIERLDEVLGHPAHDPHGDAIPTEAGVVPDRTDSILLSQAEGGMLVKVVRVSDEDPEMLRYLQSVRVTVGSVLQVGPQAPYSEDKIVSLMNQDSGGDSRMPLVFGPVIAARIRVRVIS